MTADWAQGVTSADDAVACVRSGMRIFIHGAAATPTPLIEPLARRTDLEDVTPYHLHTSGPAPFATPEQQGRFFSVSLFTGPPLCAAIDDGRADFMPVFLSDIPSLFDSGLIPIDVALLQRSPPDRHGYCTLGTPVDAALSVARNARVIVAEINEQMPRTHGNTLVPFTRASTFIATNRPLHAHDPAEPSAVENEIGGHVAALVKNGATLQSRHSTASKVARGGAVIALPATAAKGSVSRIVPALQPGAGVVTTRGHVHRVATEYGAVNLFGRSLRERAEFLISIAHPDMRADLARAYREVRHVDLEAAQA